MTPRINLITLLLAACMSLPAAAQAPVAPAPVPPAAENAAPVAATPNSATPNSAPAATLPVAPQSTEGAAPPPDTTAPAAPNAAAGAVPAPPAQTDLAKASQQIFLQALEKELTASAPNPTYVPPGVPSLFFSPSEYAALQEARSGFAIQKSEEAVLEELQSNGPTIREISLQGILFRGASDWTIWLNKQQLTPERLPLEIIDLRVHKDFIELKWFDRDANQIVPIRLRPNQRFNLDARIFLPG